MKKIELPPPASQEVLAELEQTLKDLMAGIRHPERVRAACERMDRMREANRLLYGEQNIAVELVRQTRNHQ